MELYKGDPIYGWFFWKYLEQFGAKWGVICLMIFDFHLDLPCYLLDTNIVSNTLFLFFSLVLQFGLWPLHPIFNLEKWIKIDWNNYFKVLYSVSVCWRDKNLGNKGSVEFFNSVHLLNLQQYLMLLLWIWRLQLLFHFLLIAFDLFGYIGIGEIRGLTSVWLTLCNLHRVSRLFGVFHLIMIIECCWIYGVLNIRCIRWDDESIWATRNNNMGLIFMDVWACISRLVAILSWAKDGVEIGIKNISVWADGCYYRDRELVYVWTNIEWAHLISIWVSFLVCGMAIQLGAYLGLPYYNFVGPMGWFQLKFLVLFWVIIW